MSDFGDIPANISISAGQSIRRNAGDTAFESFTPSGSSSTGVNGITYSGQWKLNAFYGLRATGTAWNGVVWWVPYIITTDHTITGVAVEVTTASASQNLRLALYTDSSGQPSSLIEESGDISAATTGSKAFTLATPYSLTTSAKVVWLAIQVSSSAIGLRYTTACNNTIGTQTTGANNDQKVIGQAYGAFPATAAGSSFNSSGNILFWVNVQ